jgi:hypothetical protein
MIKSGLPSNVLEPFAELFWSQMVETIRLNACKAPICKERLRTNSEKKSKNSNFRRDEMSGLRLAIPTKDSSSSHSKSN